MRKLGLQISKLNVDVDEKLILTNRLGHSRGNPWQRGCWQFSTGLSAKIKSI